MLNCYRKFGHLWARWCVGEVFASHFEPFFHSRERCNVLLEHRRRRCSRVQMRWISYACMYECMYVASSWRSGTNLRMNHALLALETRDCSHTFAAHSRLLGTLWWQRGPRGHFLSFDQSHLLLTSDKDKRLQDNWVLSLSHIAFQT